MDIKKYNYDNTYYNCNNYNNNNIINKNKEKII